MVISPPSPQNVSSSALSNGNSSSAMKEIAVTPTATLRLILKSSNCPPGLPIDSPASITVGQHSPPSTDQNIIEPGGHSTISPLEPSDLNLTGPPQRVEWMYHPQQSNLYCLLQTINIELLGVYRGFDLTPYVPEEFQADLVLEDAPAIQLAKVLHIGSSPCLAGDSLKEAKKKSSSFVNHVVDQFNLELEAVARLPDDPALLSNADQLEPSSHDYANYTFFSNPAAYFSIELHTTQLLNGFVTSSPMELVAIHEQHFGESITVEDLKLPVHPPYTDEAQERECFRQVNEAASLFDNNKSAVTPSSPVFIVCKRPSNIINFSLEL
ncbi:hypothetical protein GYMLUDRAFT_248300 [Collybiopsis luxurians FD-317 M1]|uniref:Uncharacterized protein n=1 Tax=Collybiopsis luxurians FD-317 M1 TaxID=944289 RepID=A0A0D0BM38_9AGAR|nr:hypothetical protein GYMLUDRAFT_248300 [Collybiopsis luxurians FD-317 M1]